MVQKGKIIAIDLMAAKVRIEVIGSQGAITPFIEMPDRLMSSVILGSQVVFIMFEDRTGIVLEQMAGD